MLKESDEIKKKSITLKLHKLIKTFNILIYNAVDLFEV